MSMQVTVFEQITYVFAVMLEAANSPRNWQSFCSGKNKVVIIIELTSPVCLQQLILL